MSRPILLAVVLVAASLHLNTTFADIIHVPQDYPTIQGSTTSRSTFWGKRSICTVLMGLK